MIYTEAIDVEEYLQSRNIPYDPPGAKNVGRNSVGIRCPFCGDHDYSGANHLGINIDTKQWFCWICGAGRGKGFLSLVVRLEGCSYRQAETLLKAFIHSDMSLIKTSADVPVSVLQGHFRLPEEAADELLPAHRAYLESRNFDPDFLFHKYKLKAVGPISNRWKLSIIVPIFVRHRAVTFTSMDITRKRSRKYIHCQNENSLIPINQTLYNADHAETAVIVTEGVTDVWRIGDGAVALYTKHATRQQRKILSAFDRIFIMLDSDASAEAEILANDMAGFADTEIIELGSGDPAEMKPDDVKHLRRQLFGS